MSPKKLGKSAKPETLKVKDIAIVGTPRMSKGVQDFGTIVGEDHHVRLQEYDGQTIYIVKLEVKASDQYGSGYLVTFKDLPNARQSYTAGVFGQYPTAQLDALYAATHDGKMINEDYPVGTTIEKIGNSYKFNPIRK